jgi:hypothetical protein
MKDWSSIKAANEQSLADGLAHLEHKRHAIY